MYLTQILFLGYLRKNFNPLPSTTKVNIFAYIFFFLRPKTCVARAVARKEEGCWEEEKK